MLEVLSSFSPNSAAFSPSLTALCHTLHYVLFFDYEPPAKSVKVAMETALSSQGSSSPNTLDLPVFIASAVLSLLQRDSLCVLFGFSDYSVGSVGLLTATLSTQKRKELIWEGQMDLNMESDLL